MNEKKRDTRWKPGQSGGGRKLKGSKHASTKLRDAIAAELPGVIQGLLNAARGGDTAAAGILISRSLPALRPTRELHAVDGIAADATPSDIALAVARAAARGELPADIASDLTAALASVAKLREVDELAARIAALEKASEARRDAE